VTNLEELADRCEMAKEADRGTDAEIYWLIETGINVYRPEAPQYTSSIDAAMTLVPEGHKWKLGYGRYVPHVAEVVDYVSHTGTYVAECDGNHALALCAAALRARASSLIRADRAPEVTKEK
jgi:hypothetical protein